MIVSGMSIGFTFKEVKKMTCVSLSSFLSAYNEVNAPAGKEGPDNGVRDATPADVKRMLM